jgi:hypothetical protein
LLARVRHCRTCAQVKHRLLRAQAIRQLPCPVPQIFIAAGALDIDLTAGTEMAWLAEGILSRHLTLPAGWEEDLGDDLGVASRAGRFRNSISGESNLPHPFRVEIATMLAAVDARAAETLEEAVAAMDAEEKRNTGYDMSDLDAISAIAARKATSRSGPASMRRASTIRNAELRRTSSTSGPQQHQPAGQPVVSSIVEVAEDPAGW